MDVSLSRVLQSFSQGFEARSRFKAALLTRVRLVFVCVDKFVVLEILSFNPVGACLCSILTVLLVILSKNCVGVCGE